MIVKGNGVLWLDSSVPIGGHRPSVDALFESIAQNEASSVVFGTPGAAVELNAADEVLDIAVIASRLKLMTENNIHEQKE